MRSVTFALERSQRIRGWFWVVAVAVALVVTVVSPSLAKPPDEDKMGQEGAQELEKQTKLVTDEAVVGRVQRIGNELAAIANATEIPATYGSPTLKKYDFKFKVLDDKDINALSMPGGYIYVNKGLVDYVQSDDELASVLAHEIAHVSHHHMLALIKEQAKLGQQMAIALVALLAARASPENTSNALMGARFIQLAKINGYSREAEEDSDLTGLQYLNRSKYSPVGMLTFMERLARDEMGRPDIQWGVYQTHPYPAERSRVLEAKLEALKIPINRRAVTRPALAEVRQNEKQKDLFEVWLGGKQFYAPSAGDQTSEARAKTLATKLNALLDQGLTLRDLKQSSKPPLLMAKGELLLDVTKADAEMDPSKDPQQIVKNAYGVLYKVLLDQQVNKLY